jgi:tetratricopeptide (TPR) repeat protein
MWADQGENLDEALALVQQAVALEPGNGAYIDSLGWAYFQLGQYDRARDYLERAAMLVGDDAIVLEHLGDLYSVLGEIDEARSAYERSLALEADNAGQVRQKLDRLIDGQ